VPPHLFRVFPFVSSARSSKAPGHALYVPAPQGAGRIDNPDLYRVLYASTSPEGAIGEAFGNIADWSAHLFVVPVILGAARSLAEYELGQDPLLDLDEARALLDRRLRPSRVVTRDRATTQSWARHIFQEDRWSGVSWWSYWNPDWVSCGVWATEELTVVSVTPLDQRLPAFRAAAETLSRPWIA
jgi:hypothetical protein